MTLCSSGDVAALEAAHITPYSEEQIYGVKDGIPLRADIHTLFDPLLLSIDPATLKVRLAPSIADAYSKLEGKPVRTPVAQYRRETLQWHHRPRVLEAHDSGLGVLNPLGNHREFSAITVNSSTSPSIHGDAHAQTPPASSISMITSVQVPRAAFAAGQGDVRDGHAALLLSGGQGSDEPSRPLEDGPPRKDLGIRLGPRLAVAGHINLGLLRPFTQGESQQFTLHSASSALLASRKSSKT